MKNLHFTHRRYESLKAAWQKNPTLESLLKAVEIEAGPKAERLGLPRPRAMMLEGFRVDGSRCMPAELILVVPGIILLLPREDEIDIENSLSYAGLLHWSINGGCGLWMTSPLGPDGVNCIVGIESRCPKNNNQPCIVFRGKGDSIYQITPGHYDDVNNFIHRWIDYNLRQEGKDDRNSVIESDEEK